MKKIIACLAAAVMLCGACAPGAAAQSGQEGEFRILQVSGAQGVDGTAFSDDFLKAVIEKEQPDLVLYVSHGGAPGAAAATAQPSLQYQNGQLRVLVFTDLHQDAGDYPPLYAFLGEAIDYARPDLVVYNGDIVTGSACASKAAERAAIAKVVAPAVARGVPFAFVFGNHDQEYQPGGQDSRAAMLRFYQEHPGCLAFDEAPAISGVSNYHIPVYSSDGAALVSNLWFLDSGAYPREGEPGEYDWVRKDQIDWYTRTSEVLEAQAGHKVPSLLFQHIIVPEVYDIYPALPVDLYPLTMDFLGKHRLLLPDFTKLSGVMLERPCPPAVSEGEFDAWAARGDVLAAIFGHDHTNNFTLPLRGVDLVGIPSSGFHIDRSEVNSGATLFTLSEADPWSYRKENVSYRKLAALPGSALAGQLAGAKDYLDGRRLQFWALYGLELAVQSLLWAGDALLGRLK